MAPQHISPLSKWGPACPDTLLPLSSSPPPISQRMATTETPMAHLEGA